MSYFSEILNKTRTKVDEWIAKLGGVPGVGIPKEKDDRVGQFVTTLFEDSQSYRNAVFLKSKDARFSKGTYIQWMEDCLKLESGNHWEVWGHRTSGTENAWKQEETDDEISDQIRMRIAYLTGAWHDVQVSPNINNINSILDRERELTDWSHTILQSVKQMKYFGDADVLSVLDTSEDPRGLATEIVAEKGSVFYNPFAKSKKKRDGCWYALHAQMVSGQWVKENFPEFNANKLTEVENAMARQIAVYRPEGEKSYQHTKLYPVLTVYLDDDTTEDIPFDQEEFDAKIALLLEGQDVPVQRDENHKKYIEAYHRFSDERVAFAEELLAKGGLTEEDQRRLTGILQLIEMQIDEHMKVALERQREDGLPPNQQKRYPFGRRIITISGEVAEDKRNPYHFDWRHLFHRVYNEEIPARLDGRGDVEILYNVNKSIDKNLSRFADSLLLNMPKPWLPIADKATIEAEGYDNDPMKPAYYSQSPPEFPRAIELGEALKLHTIQKENATKKLGINEVTYGQPPTKQASGDLAETLLNQNAILVTGEGNANLSDMIEDIIETRLLIMRQFYTEPRLYTINGVQTAVTVSEILKFVSVQEGDQIVEKPITDFEVSVRPESNFPQKWERTLGILARFSTMAGPDGTPVVPVEMFQDLLSERFPELGINGKYRRISKATALGMKALAQEEAKKKEEEQTLTNVKEQFKNRALSEMLNPIQTGAGNGKGQAQS